MNKYLEFILIEKKPKTNVYAVRSVLHGYILGVIKWYPQWRQYTFFPETDTVYNSECLKSIEEFITSKMQERK